MLGSLLLSCAIRTSVSLYDICWVVKITEITVCSLFVVVDQARGENGLARLRLNIPMLWGCLTNHNSDKYQTKAKPLSVVWFKMNEYV